MALGLLQVDLGVSHVRPERKGLCPVFLCHMLPSLCLYLLPVGSSEHRLASVLFLRKPQGLGL